MPHRGLIWHFSFVIIQTENSVCPYETYEQPVPALSNDFLLIFLLSFWRTWFQDRDSLYPDVGRSLGASPVLDLVWRSDRLLREISGADQWNHVSFDFIGPTYWFPVATDWIIGLSLKVELLCHKLAPSHKECRILEK